MVARGEARAGGGGVSAANHDETLRVLRTLVDPRDPSVTPRARVNTLVDAFGRAEYVSGFTAGISAAWCILGWATTGVPQVPRKDIATWARGKIAEAYRLAGIEMPEDGCEP